MQADLNGKLLSKTQKSGTPLKKLVVFGQLTLKEKGEKRILINH